MLLHARPYSPGIFHHWRDLVPSHERPSTALRDHRLHPLSFSLGTRNRILDIMPNKKQRGRPEFMSSHLQKRQRLPLHPVPHSGPRERCRLSSGRFDRAVSATFLPLTTRPPNPDTETI